MNKIKLYFTFALLVISHTSIAQITNHVFALDNSGSMEEPGNTTGTLSIWKKTQLKICDFIRGGSIKKNDTVSIYYFSQDISSGNKFFISSDADKEVACKYIYDISADGINTCIYNSLDKLFDQLGNSVKGPKIIYVLTDSIEDCPTPRVKEADIKNKFSILKSSDFAYLYYIKDKGFPEWMILTDSVVVDFSAGKNITIRVPVRTKGVVSKIGCLFQSDNNAIHLLDTAVIVQNDSLDLRFQVNNDYYSNNTQTGEIHFSSGAEYKTVRTVFILPAKKKVRITIN